MAGTGLSGTMPMVGDMSILPCTWSSALTAPAVSKNAPPEAIDFLKFFMSKENQDKLNTDGVGLSTTVGTESTVSDPNLQAVLAGRGQAQFMQLYLDQATSPALGLAINDATVGLFLGASQPADVCKAITDAAATQ